MSFFYLKKIKTIRQSVWRVWVSKEWLHSNHSQIGGPNSQINKQSRRVGSRPRQTRAGQGTAGRAEPGQGRPGQGRAGQGRPGQALFSTWSNVICSTQWIEPSTRRWLALQIRSLCRGYLEHISKQQNIQLDPRQNHGKHGHEKQVTRIRNKNKKAGHEQTVTRQITNEQARKTTQAFPAPYPAAMWILRILVKMQEHLTVS